MMTDIVDVPDTMNISACGCRSYHALNKQHETWTYDYCLREMRMSKGAAQLALMLFTASFASRHAPEA
jgi:hypothetical protein